MLVPVEADEEDEEDEVPDEAEEADDWFELVEPVLPALFDVPRLRLRTAASEVSTLCATSSVASAAWLVLATSSDPPQALTNRLAIEMPMRGM
ncbi:MAG TPA: hypothetical protein PKA20_15020 [Burkholderiaceae bacterium]|nr:hypothetical protein [Burkholderiaceae bacterium]